MPTRTLDILISSHPVAGLLALEKFGSHKVTEQCWFTER
jgi:hypothetical protein